VKKRCSFTTLYNATVAAKRTRTAVRCYILRTAVRLNIYMPAKLGIRANFTD